MRLLFIGFPTVVTIPMFTHTPRHKVFEVLLRQVLESVTVCQLICVMTIDHAVFSSVNWTCFSFDVGTRSWWRWL